MICPNCGKKVKGKICKYCNAELPYDERALARDNFITNFCYIFDSLLCPPAKVMFIFWTLDWIALLPQNQSNSFFSLLAVIIFGYFFMCGIPNALYFASKKRKNAYQIKIIEKKRNRLQKTMDKYFPYKKLLDEARTLENIINTTTDENTFEISYNRLIDILRELKKYEHFKVFTNSPTEDLNNLIYGREAATKRFLERSCKKINSYDKNVTSNFQSSTPNALSTDCKPTSFQTPENADPYFIDAARLVIEKDKGSIGILQRYFKIGFNRAAHIMDQLEAAGIVGPEQGTAPRRVLMTLRQFEQYLKDGMFCFPSNESDDYPVLSDTNERVALYNNQYDYMDGHDFEYYCADILKKNGFSNVEVTQGSGDHGIDILADKDDISYAIQCKCYSSNIGNAAVQQAHTGKSIYHKDIAVVLTNQYFTAQAKEEADVLGVKLWDRDKLQELINNSQ